MVEAAEILANMLERHRRKLPCQVHTHLPWHQDVAEAAPAAELAWFHAKVPPYERGDPLDARPVDFGLIAKVGRYLFDVERASTDFTQRRELADGSDELATAAGQVCRQPI